MDLALFDVLLLTAAADEDVYKRQPQIRKFMSYYLPTTLKLLRAYDDMSRQGVQGENIPKAITRSTSSSATSSPRTRRTSPTTITPAASSAALTATSCCRSC